MVLYVRRVLSDRIKAVRWDDLRLTQSQLADKLGVHPMTVSRWERGERTPDADVVAEIARLTGWVPVEWFYLDEEDA